MFGLTPYGKKNYGLTRNDNIFDFRNVFNDFFNDSFFPSFFNGNQAMKADIRQTEKEYIVDAEIPGVNKEDIKLDLRDDVLTISVEHDEQKKEEHENYIRQERRYGSYSRSFYVENVRTEDVTAKYNNGILTIVLPKSEEAKKNSHKIDVQ